MTREQIEAMPAGPEMDALVAERVMHTDEKCVCLLGPVDMFNPQTGICRFCGHMRAKAYSSNIAAAWEVVEKVIHGRHVRFSTTIGSHMQPFAEFFDLATGMSRFQGSAPTAPLAICRAALLATLNV